MVKRNKYMNVPEIRFKGLDKTWNKKTLDELVQLNSIIRKTKNSSFKNEKSKKTANDLLIAFIV